MSGRECAAACADASSDISACARTSYERRQLPRHAAARFFLTDTSFLSVGDGYDDGSMLFRTARMVYVEKRRAPHKILKDRESIPAQETVLP